MSENLKIWSAVDKTDPSATKAATVSGQKITSINGIYMVRRATETFGPVGIGWGWDVIEERFDKGGAIYAERKDKDGNLTNELVGHEVGHVIRLRLWFVQSGARGEVEQYGCTPFTYKSKWGITTDTEAPKKSLTDAIKKALSMLGFSADIFMGLFDNQEYVAERTAEAAIEKDEDREAAAEQHQQERLDWLRSSVDLLSTAASMNELTKLHAKFVRAANTRNESAFIRRLDKAMQERKATLENKQ